MDDDLSLMADGAAKAGEEACATVDSRDSNCAARADDPSAATADGAVGGSAWQVIDEEDAEAFATGKCEEVLVYTHVYTHVGKHAYVYAHGYEPLSSTNQRQRAF